MQFVRGVWDKYPTSIPRSDTLPDWMLKKWRAIRGQPARSRIWRSLPRAEDRKAWIRPCGGGGGVCRHVVFSVTDTHDCTPYCTETWKYRSTSCAKDVPTLLWRSGSWARMGWVRAPSSQKEVPTGDAFRRITSQDTFYAWACSIYGSLVPVSESPTKP